MKIVLMCWRDTTHPQGGGSERYLERVGSYLAQQGHQVVYRTAGRGSEYRDGIFFIRGGGKFTVYPRAWLAMLCGRFGFGDLSGTDVVVDTQNGIPFFARIFSGAPTVILTHHCHKEQWPVAGKILAKIGWFLESKVSPRVHRGCRYITVSEASRRELESLGVRDITVIRNGVDPVPEFTPLPHEGTHIVTLSRLVPHKQIEHAMDVVAALPDVVLDVIGSGWWASKLHAYAHDLGVADRVVFHGQVTEEHKHALLDRAKVHLMPSRKEGWGLAVTEAALHGVPTIGYRSSGGLQDSVQLGALANNKAELIRLTAAYLNAPPGLPIDASDFSWTATGRAVAELLEGVTSPR
ncbi:glycosyltransferase family 4 protein [Corynebacterium canis]|uniref:Glycosyltransferase family 4 protein n=1 Tax=Corynebacterium canis TaxID=679663 RepID=A0A5C5UKT2_9CORY|nr:glycosyltransferase family 4 protein [Corynebacterium canis]TWT26626.1 glycosyltransferase family 4 protein [Corynebacterium canis]WJY76411.1 GDP-mannose-dependent alpha-(1-6)-phosphatidylinositol monomannoside mannosyltransferase [Corynebacterium canis]